MISIPLKCGRYVLTDWNWLENQKLVIRMPDGHPSGTLMRAASGTEASPHRL